MPEIQNRDLIICLKCDRYHYGKTKYGGECPLSEAILSSDMTKEVLNEYLERKFPEFKGLRVVIGLFDCPQFISEDKPKGLSLNERELLLKLGIKF